MNNFKISENNNKIVIKIDEITTEIITKYEEKHKIIDEIKNMLFGKDNLKIDFEDFKYIAKKSNGVAFIGVGHKMGKDSAYEALKEAIKGLSFYGIDIINAKSLLINTITNENYPLVDFDEAFDFILKDFIENEETDILQSEFCDESFADDEIKVTIIATGFESE